MNQEIIGKSIKEIRKKYNLTQAEFAEKYGVTYQAVSKWENGKNIPDISLLKQISNDFNINFEDILDGKITPKKPKNNKLRLIILISSIIILFLLVIIVVHYLNENHTFEFKTLSANCEKFNISGSLAYNDNKSSIYISNITYCGGEDNTEYKNIECILYETNNNMDKRIDEYVYENEEKTIKLEDFLKNITFTIDNYSRICKQYKENTLYLQINAVDKENKITSYRVPLSIDEKCL